MNYINNNDLTTGIEYKVDTIGNYITDPTSSFSLYRYDTENSTTSSSIYRYKTYNELWGDTCSSTTTDNYGWNTWLPTTMSSWRPVIKTPSERMREILRSRHAPAIIRGKNRTSVVFSSDIREQRARQTLRRIIGEKSFRRFLKDGFLSVTPKSGLVYRIYPGHGITEVYDRGIMVERLCVVLKGNFPPTDSLLMRYLLILNDEGEFSKYAIKHSIYSDAVIKLPVVRSLVEEWSSLKVA